jgi:ubiquinone/menaquinone biosynthesis C-methylase UbiE
MIGVLPRAPTLAAESHLDFCVAVRNFAINDLFGRVATQISERVASEASGATPMPMARLVSLADSLPLVRTWKRLMRSQQQASWDRIRATLLADAGRYERELHDAERLRSGRLHYDPNFVTPDYAKHPIHLQPGGYVGDALAGYVFHYGTRVFYQGLNDQDELHHLYAGMLRAPADGRIARILDLGCSIGQGTTALKQRFPQAEVWGLDVALPMVRYGHKRAVDLGVDVHFKQALAESTGFPNQHFDAVFAHILFHEVPQSLFTAIVAEARRVLRPGGTFTIVDAPNDISLPAPNRMWQQFDAEHNCEPYAPAFVATDLRELLLSEGFRDVRTDPTPTFLWCTHTEKPVAQ